VPSPPPSDPGSTAPGQHRSPQTTRQAHEQGPHKPTSQTLSHGSADAPRT
jgi:hypothetical protein